MSLEELIRDVKKQVRVNDYTQITEDFFKKYMSNMFIEKSETNDFGEFSSKLREAGLNIINLKQNMNNYKHIIYDDGFIVVPAWFKYETTYESFLKLILDQMERLYMAWNKSDFDVFFRLYDSNFTFDFFISNYKSIPKDKLYRVFQNIYIHSDRSFSMLNREVIEYVYDTKDREELNKSLNDLVDSNEYLYIYRGEGSYSTPKEMAYSWTINLNIANFFAFRYGTKSKVYRGRIHKSKVLDYIGERREEYEIIARYEDIENVEVINKYTIDYNDFPTLDNIIIEYKQLISVLWMLKGEVFDPDGVHGLLHIQRVILLTLLITKKVSIEDSDKIILIISALLHDIARKNNNVDHLHGTKALKKIKQNKIMFNIFNSKIKSAEDRIICEMVIAGHALNDKVAEDLIIKNEGIENKKRAITLLKRFKDIDALDRVRLRSELDEKYLRFPESIDFIGVAYELLMNLEQIE